MKWNLLNDFSVCGENMHNNLETFYLICLIWKRYLNLLQTDMVSLTLGYYLDKIQTLYIMYSVFMVDLKN